MATAIYKALGVEATSRVAVKVSTGEGSNPNYLKPELIKNLVHEVDGTIVECNTAYGNGPGDEKDGTRRSHWLGYPKVPHCQYRQVNKSPIYRRSGCATRVDVQNRFGHGQT